MAFDLVPSLIVLCLGLLLMAQGFRARPVGTVRLGVLDGALGQGRSISWRLRVFVGAMHVVAAIVVAALLFVLRKGGPDFALTIPPGWVDVTTAAPPPTLNATAIRTLQKGIPTEGRAIAAATGDHKRTSLFVAIVDDTRWEPTLERLKRSAAQNMEGSDRLAGVSVDIGNYSLPTVGGSAAGRYETTITYPDHATKSIVYILPGSNSRATLLLTSDVLDIERDLPAFMQVVEHSRLRPPLAPWLRFLPFASWIAVVLGALITNFTAKRDAPSPVVSERPESASEGPPRPKRTPVRDRAASRRRERQAKRE